MYARNEEEMKKAFIYEMKLGRFIIAEDGEGITYLSLLNEVSLSQPLSEIEQEHLVKSLGTDYVSDETSLIKEAAQQLEEYLEGNRKEFTIKLAPQGTVFQQKVWKALLEIPYGETRSYQQIARTIGNPKAYRAVGMANHNNPIMCVIPCHRVIGANGKMVGYAGGVDIKIRLLQLEQGILLS